MTTDTNWTTTLWECDADADVWWGGSSETPRAAGKSARRELLRKQLRRKLC